GLDARVNFTTGPPIARPGIHRAPATPAASARTTHAPASSSEVRRVGPAPGADGAVSDRNAGLVSDAAHSVAVAKRSAGNFSSALSIAAATFAGTDRRRDVTGCARSGVIFMQVFLG